MSSLAKQGKRVMKLLKKTGVVALAMATVVVGTAVAQNQDQLPQQSTSPGWSWGPHGMMGSGFMGPGVMGYGGMGRWMMEGNESVEVMCSAMASHIDGRLGYVKAELKITDAQEPLWNN